MKILISDSAPHLWQKVLNEAISSIHTQIEPRLEHYMIQLLLQQTCNVALFSRTFSLSFLGAWQVSEPEQRQVAFQNVADGCLIISGFFPHYARKQVDLAYFVRLGRHAYQQLSTKNNDLYAALSLNFVNLMDILQETKKNCTDQLLYLPLDLYEQWVDLGSRRALQLIRGYTKNSLPIKLLSKHN